MAEKRYDVITWARAQEVFESVMRDYKKHVAGKIQELINLRQVSPCCKCAFYKGVNRMMRDEWPERLEKILLKQSKKKKRGKVYTRHWSRKRR